MYRGSSLACFKKAGTKLGPDQLGSLDPGRINSDQPGSTRIELKFEHNKRKGILNKRKRILLRIYGLTVMKIKQSLLSCTVLSSRHFVFLVPGPRGSSLKSRSRTCTRAVVVAVVICAIWMETKVKFSLILAIF